MSAVRNSSLNYGSASSKSAFDGFIDKVNSQNSKTHFLEN